MADVTISSLPLGTPSGNGVIPFSLGGNTYQAPISGLFQNRPAFFVGKNNGQLNPVNGEVVIFNATEVNKGYFNQGNYYNTSTSTFTAPYSGLYSLNVNALINQTGGYYYILLYSSINADNYRAISYMDGDGRWRTSNISTILNLRSGEEISVRFYRAGQSSISIDNSGSFSGYFIG